MALEAALSAAVLQAIATQRIVALKIDPHSRAHEWVTLGDGTVPPELDTHALLHVISCAGREVVHPALYYIVQRARGCAQPTDYAPYVLKRSFGGARIVLWTRDDGPENLPAARFSFKGASAGGRWMDTSFVVAYPKLPAESSPAVPVPGTGYATRPGDAQFIMPLDTRRVLKAALKEGTFSVEWLTAAEADAEPPSSFAVSLRVSTASDGRKVIETVETILRFQCAVCAAPCNLRCKRCEAVAYCTAACQKSAWKQHKKVCAPPPGASGSGQAGRA